MTGIVLALAAIITPTRVNIPRSYLVLFAVSPLVMIPFILFGPLTATSGVVLVLLFVAFIGYVASQGAPEHHAGLPERRDPGEDRGGRRRGATGPPPARTGPPTSLPSR